MEFEYEKEEIINYANLMNKVYSEKGPCEEWEEARKFVLENCDALWNYHIARRCRGVDVAAHEKVVLGAWLPALSFEFAKNVPGANISEHEKIVLFADSPKLSISFARNVPGADVRAHGMVVAKYKDLGLNLEFSAIPGADIALHGQVVIEKGSSQANINYARLPGADVRGHGQAVIDRGESYANLCFAREFIGVCDIKGHAQVVISEGVAWDNYYFSLLPGVDVRAHGEIVIKKGGATLNCDFAKAHQENCDVQGHANVVLSFANAEQCLDFAGNVKGVEVKPFEDVVLEHGEPSEWFKFSKIPGADVQRLWEKVKVSGDVSAIKAFAKRFNFEYAGRKKVNVSQDHSVELKQAVESMKERIKD